MSNNSCAIYYSYLILSNTTTITTENLFHSNINVIQPKPKHENYKLTLQGLGNYGKNI